MTDNSTDAADPGKRLPLYISVTFLALIFSLGFMQPNMWVGRSRVQATEVLFLATLIATLIAASRGKIRPRFDTIYIVFGLYFCALVISTVFSERPQVSMMKLGGEAYLMMFASVAALVVSDKSMLRRTILVWIAASTAVSVLGILSAAYFYFDPSGGPLGPLLHHYGSLPAGNYPRIQSTFLYPAMLCNYLSVGLLFVLASGAAGWLSRRTAAALASVHLAAAIFTVTPGIGGIMLAFGLWFGTGGVNSVKPHWRRAAAAAGLAGAAAFLTASAFAPRAVPTSPYYFTAAEYRIDPSQRLLAWQSSFETFLTDPITGRGLGTGAAYVQFITPNGERQVLTDAHNTFLNVAAESGLPAALCLAAICAVLLLRIRRTMAIPNARTVILTAMGIAVVSAFIYQGLMGSFEDARHLWVLFGLVIGSARSGDG